MSNNVEREAFEKQMYAEGKYGGNLLTNFGTGDYIDDVIQARWTLWQEAWLAARSTLLADMKVAICELERVRSRMNAMQADPHLLHWFSNLGTDVDRINEALTKLAAYQKGDDNDR